MENSDTAENVHKLIEAIKSAEALLSRWDQLPRALQHQLLWEEVKMAFLLPRRESLLLTRLVLKAGDHLVQEYPSRMETVRHSLEARQRLLKPKVICLDIIYDRTPLFGIDITPTN